MAIANINTVAQIVARGGRLFVSEDSGTTYFDLGTMKEGLMISWTNIDTDPDTFGRPVQLAADVEIAGVLRQTSDADIAGMDDLNAVATNGLWMKVTTQKTNAAGAGAATGYLFKGVFPRFSGELKLDFTQSAINLMVNGRVSMADLAALGTSQEIVFDL